MEKEFNAYDVMTGTARAFGYTYICPEFLDELQARSWHGGFPASGEHNSNTVRRAYFEVMRDLRVALAARV